MNRCCAALLLLCFGIVSGNARELPDPVAIAGNEQIHPNDLQTAINRALAIAGKTRRELSDGEEREMQNACLDGLIRDSLLKQRARNVAVPAGELDAAFASFRAQFESEERMNSALERQGASFQEIGEMISDRLRERKWIESHLAPINVTAAETRKFYAEHPEAFQLPERIRASHILVLISADMPPETVEEKRAAAHAIAARAKAGESFAQLAAELSDDPSAKGNNGDLNYFSRERMEPAFSAAAFALKPGDISDPVRTKFGYHIIRVTDRKPARTLSFDEARASISAQLHDDKRRAAVAELLRSVRNASVVTVNLPGR